MSQTNSWFSETSAATTILKLHRSSRAEQAGTPVLMARPTVHYAISDAGVNYDVGMAM